MNNTNNIQRVVSFSSKKNQDGTFTGTAYSFDFQVANVVHATFNRKTRAQAVGATKKAVKALKNIQRAAA